MSGGPAGPRGAGGERPCGAEPPLSAWSAGLAAHARRSGERGGRQRALAGGVRALRPLRPRPPSPGPRALPAPGATRQPPAPRGGALRAAWSPCLVGPGCAQPAWGVLLPTLLPPTPRTPDGAQGPQLGAPLARCRGSLVTQSASWRFGFHVTFPRCVPFLSDFSARCRRYSVQGRKRENRKVHGCKSPPRVPAPAGDHPAVSEYLTAFGPLGRCAHRYTGATPSPTSVTCIPARHTRVPSTGRPSCGQES